VAGGGRDPDQPQQVGIDLLLDHVIAHRLAVGEVVFPLDSGVIDDARRPAMMIWFPSLWNASTSSRPIPDPPPVMNIVFDCIFIEVYQSL